MFMSERRSTFAMLNASLVGTLHQAVAAADSFAPAT